MSTRPAIGAKVFVDTNAFAAISVRREQNHLRAVESLRQLSGNRCRLYTSNFVVAETHALILARDGRDAALRALHRIEQGATTVIRIDEVDDLRARHILAHYHDKDYTLTDATSFAVMERLGIVEAFTFDRHFRQYGFTVLGLDP